MNPRKAITAVAIAVGLSLTSIPAAAQDGDVFSCPAGTTFNYKVDNLSGFTFTVPTPPTGWTITGVIIKVGGPGGGSHITFTPVTPGQVLSVANQQYEISHVHVCKKPTTTTSSSTTTSTSTTTTTTMPPTTTTICVDCTPGTQVIIPTTTTTLPPPGGDTPGTTTTTAAPAVTTTTAASPTGGGATTTVPNPTNPPAPTTTVATALPSTGKDANLAIIALCIGALGTILVRAARRP